jgi:hypothetical protein
MDRRALRGRLREVRAVHTAEAALVADVVNTGRVGVDASLAVTLTAFSSQLPSKSW